MTDMYAHDRHVIGSSREQFFGEVEFEETFEFILGIISVYKNRISEESVSLWN